MAKASFAKLPLYDCQKTLLTVRQQAITWANIDPDLCRHMASLDHNELSIVSIIHIMFYMFYISRKYQQEGIECDFIIHISADNLLDGGNFGKWLPRLTQSKSSKCPPRWCLVRMRRVPYFYHRDCSAGGRTASEIGRSPHLVAVTWKYKKLV